MLFWIKSFVLTFCVIAAFGAVLHSYKGHNTGQNSANEANSNKLSGFTQFYQKHRLEKTQDTLLEDKKYIIELELPDQTLTETLLKFEYGSRTVSGAWVGPYKNHRFAQGDQLKERMQKIAESSHMNLIWWLKKDYIVKHPFRINNTSMGALTSIASAIGSDFQRPLKTFFCPLQRTMVITDQPEHYLRDHCREGTKKS